MLGYKPTLATIKAASSNTGCKEATQQLFANPSMQTLLPCRATEYAADQANRANQGLTGSSCAS
jgi:hypothetical protein